MRKLPPLNALRAFEATARLQGVHKAALELCVTHGAVSRQIKQLEQWLGVSLFERSTRSLVLNEQGRAYLASITAALDLVEQSSSAIKPVTRAKSIGLSTTHSIANKWLIKRLNKFSQEFDTEIWLNLEQRCIAFDDARIDLSIRMGAGPWPTLHCIELLEDQLIAVASPNYISAPLSDAKELANYKLLHDQDPASQWLRLFNDNKLPLIDLSKGARLGSSDLLLNSAVEGQGVALVSKHLACEDIASGRLIQVLQESVDLGVNFWIVMAKGSLQKNQVRQFCHWLEADLAVEQALKSSVNLT